MYNNGNQFVSPVLGSQPPQPSPQPFCVRPRRRSFLERLKQNIGPNLTNPSSTLQNNAPGDNRVLVRNVKDLLRQGIPVSEVSKVTAQLLGDTTRKESQSQSSEMEVDESSSVCFRKHGRNAYSVEGRTQRKSFHVHMNTCNSYEEVRRRRRINSFENTRTNFDFSQDFFPESTTNMQIEESNATEVTKDLKRHPSSDKMNCFNIYPASGQYFAQSTKKTRI